MPEFKTQIKTQETKKDYSLFSIEPLEPGFGHTLGNSLRRVLLSSLPGAAIVKIKISGVPHEFTAIDGVKEDLIEIIFNLKKINFQMEKKQPQIVSLEVTGPGEILAGDFKTPTGIKVLNRDQLIATLADKKTKLEMELTVEYGRGYHLAGKEEGGVGVVYLDSNFSPVRRVNYRVEKTRVGRITDLDRLIIEIYTDGSITPKTALQQAAAILVQQFEIIRGEVKVEEVVRRKKEIKKKEEKTEIYLEELNLPLRVLNTLKKAKLQTVSDVEAIGEEGLKKIKNVGPKTITLVTRRITELKEQRD